MPTIKQANALKTVAKAKRFSLVPADAQRKMYKALAALKPAKSGTASGAEVAEIALCLAIGEHDPVLRAYSKDGTRLVSKAAKFADGKTPGANGSRLAAATLSAVAALLGNATATALVCVGRIDPQEDYRSAFSFAARHRLSILFLVANTLTPGRRQVLDFRTLYAEFGIPVFSVDANDAIAAYRVATEALHNARHLRGPCVIEALTVNGTRQNAVSPLELLRNYMERHGSWPL
jgi:hypothetical protein